MDGLGKNKSFACAVLTGAKLVVNLQIILGISLDLRVITSITEDFTNTNIESLVTMIDGIEMKAKLNRCNGTKDCS